MAREEFQRTIAVASSHDEAWAILTDPDQVVSWVNIIHSIQEVERLKRYTAVLEDKVGPFRLRADLAIDVAVPVDGEVVTVSASGRDRAVNSQIKIEAELQLTKNADAGSTISLKGYYVVSGRVATMGAGIVRKKGEIAIDEFVANATRALGTADGSPAAAE